METLKKEAIEAISKLPDTATIEEIMYRLYVIDKIHKGKDAVGEGKTISIQYLEKEVQSC
jgi:hypothetical protein